jgi:uncharacterized OsmC-like protein
MATVGKTLASVYMEVRKQQNSSSSPSVISHGATVTRIEGFYQESNLHHFKVYSDEHAKPWGGTDKAPSPLGYLLSAIGFSINNQILIQSEVNGVKLESLETVVTGWFDPKGSLDIRGHNPKLSKIALEFKAGTSSSIRDLNRVIRKAASCDVIYQTLAGAAKMQTKLTLVVAKPSEGGAQRGNESH